MLHFHGAHEKVSECMKKKVSFLFYVENMNSDHKKYECEQWKLICLKLLKNLK